MASVDDAFVNMVSLSLLPGVSGIDPLCCPDHISTLRTAFKAHRTRIANLLDRFEYLRVIDFAGAWFIAVG